MSRVFTVASSEIFWASRELFFDNQVANVDGTHDDGVAKPSKPLPATMTSMIVESVQSFSNIETAALKMSMPTEMCYFHGKFPALKSREYSRAFKENSGKKQ